MPPDPSAAGQAQEDMLLLPPLVGNDVSLLPFLKEHVTDAYLCWLNDPEVVRYTEARFTHHTREDAEAYVEACNRPANARLWRIVVDGAHVGNLRLSNIDMYHRRAYVALIIGSKDHRGRGIGTKAINLVAHYGFEELGLHKLCAGIYANHLASRRALRCANRPAGPCGATGRPRRELRSSMASLRRSYRLRCSGGDPGKGDA